MNYREKIEEKRKKMVETLLQYIENTPKQWEQGWCTMPAFPQNAKTGKSYKGLNAFYLAVVGAMKGYSDPRWATFNQAKELGASVKAGEQASEIFYWSWYDVSTKKPFAARTIEGMDAEEALQYRKDNVRPVLKYFQVFNADQCENFPKRESTAVMSDEERRRQNVRIEEIIRNSEATIKYGGASAYYSPAKDLIKLPKIEDFKSMQDYYATALHEIAHSTGHPSRLNRSLITSFGSPEYAKEELRAELSSVFVQAELGISIEGSHFENHGAYLASWLRVAKGDPKELFAAASDAEKISNYIVEHCASKEQTPTPKENSEHTSRSAEEEQQTISRGLSFANQVDAVLNGADTTSTHLEVLKRTPPLLRELEKKSSEIPQEAHGNGEAEAVATTSKAHRLSKDNARRLGEIERNVPQEMKAIPHWCVYRTKWNADKGKKDKFILNPADGHWAKSSDEKTWTSFEAALDYARKNNCEGLAFALTQASGITCIDLDKCYNEQGDVSELAKRVTQLFPTTYTERSASGNGLHVFVRGDLTANGAYKNRAETPYGEIEAYSQARFISVTGNSINGKTELTIPTDIAADEIRKLLGRRTPPTQLGHAASDYMTNDDAEILARIQKSRRAREYEALSRGDNVTGDRSRNDWQMAKILAFFSAGDAAQVARIMRASGINRPDKPDVYYERTAQKAVDTLTARYGDIEQEKTRESKENLVPTRENKGKQGSGLFRGRGSL